MSRLDDDPRNYELALEALNDEAADFEAADFESEADLEADLEAGSEADFEASDFEADFEAGGRRPGLRGTEDFESPELSDEQLEIIGTDDRRRVTNTRVTPFRYIVNLTLDNLPFASGTLIGPKTVLTAGHCVWDDSTNKRFNPARMKVIPGRDDATAPFGVAQAVDFKLAPGWAGTASFAGPRDFAIIHLREPIGNWAGYWRRRYTRSRVDPVGTSMSSAPLTVTGGKLSVNVSGYPGDMPPVGLGCRTGASPTCAGSPMGSPGRSPRCGSVQYCALDQFVEIKDGMLVHRADTCPGHSGSPVWARRAPELGGRVLVGVHVARGNLGVPMSALMLTFINANFR